MATSSQSARWIYNPALDLVVGCGAWSVPLILLSYSSFASSPRWAIAFYALALFFNYPHYMSTLYRAYHTQAEFRKYRLFTIHLTGLVLLTVIVTHLHFSLLPWIFTLYLTISPWHYSGQNYGLFMMFVRRVAAEIDEMTRQAIYCSFVLCYAILFLSLHTGPSDRLFLSIGIPEKAALGVRIVLTAAFLAASAYGLCQLVRRLGWKPMTPPLVLFSTQVLWFLVPGVLALLKGISLPQSRYSTGVLPLMHSAQYLWITSYYARRESSTEGTRWRPFAYFAILIVGGVALFVPGPWLVSYVFHLDFSASFLVFTALVNLHHFILDGAIWKLRDGRIAALLLNTKKGALAAAGSASQSAGRIWLWMRSREPLPRTFRIATATVLLGLAALDQTRYALVVHGNDLASLKKAAVLNPFDAGLETRIANHHADQGDAVSAVSGYELAISTNRSDPAPRKAFLKYLVANQRYSEADVVAANALARWPDDPDLLVNKGILASYLGRTSDAVTAWQKALEIDPGQVYTHVYLAEQLNHQHNYNAAAVHYTAFLDQVARSGARPDPNLLLPVLMKLAECDLRLNRPEQALKLYELGRTIAAQTSQPKMESVASLNQAVLEAKSGQTKNALLLYQRALSLDRRLNDSSAEAGDWQAYAVFLNDHGYDQQLAYAGLVRAESILGAESAQFLPSSQELRSHLESALGKNSRSIRSNPGPLLEQALQLSE